jgi:peptidoglycan hydrolase-like protein with peptidoglycan-binding domain
VRSPGVRAGASPGTVERRRRIFLLAALALAVVIVIVVVVATSGGGGGSSSAPATTPQTTQPTTSPGTTTTTTTTTTTPTPSLHVTVPAGGNLSVGDSGSAVLTLQKALAALGFYEGTLDGDFGSGTQAAVIAFQEAHNLAPDGIVGTDTARALNQALAAAGR